VKEVLPEFVYKTLLSLSLKGAGYETVACVKIVSVLVAGVNELDSQVRSLESTVKDTLARLAVLENK
jgi:hypothetical protein